MVGQAGGRALLGGGEMKVVAGKQSDMQVDIFDCADQIMKNANDYRLLGLSL
jgi:hypothetical protein